MRDSSCSKRLCLVVGLVFTLCIFLGGFCSAQTKSDYPKKNINLVCMWPPGGGADTAARIFTKYLGQILGEKIIVQNIPGGGGSAGYFSAKGMKNDGYNLVLIQGNLPEYKYKGLAGLNIDDFDVLGSFAFQSPIVVAKSESPWKTAKDLVEDAKRSPGKYKVAINTIGDACMHQPLVLWMEAAKFHVSTIAHEVSTQQTAALVGGHVDAMVSWVKPNIPYVKEGKLKFLGYISPRRLSDYPDVPTLIDLGYDVAYEHPYGIGGPKGLPEEVKKIISDATKKIWDIPEFSEELNKLGLTVFKLDGPSYRSHLFNMQKNMEKALAIITGQKK